MSAPSTATLRRAGTAMVQPATATWCRRTLSNDERSPGGMRSANACSAARSSVLIRRYSIDEPSIDRPHGGRRSIGGAFIGDAFTSENRISASRTATRAAIAGVARHVVRDLELARHVTPSGAEEREVRVRGAVVLSDVLRPRVDDVRLDDHGRVGEVPEQAPPARPRPSALALHLAHVLDELVVLFGCHVIPDRDQHRTV